MAADRFVRTEADKRDGSRYTLAHAFSCAGAGIASTLRRERNMKIHLAIAIVALALCAILPVPAWGVVAVVICIGSVMALECVNTAIEAVVDMVSPEWNELAKLAKDAAAGATLIVAVMSVVVGGIVFVPALMSLLGC